MRVLNRDLRRLATAPLQARHWKALGRMTSTYRRPDQALGRYLSNGGSYPWEPTLRTPLGPVRPYLRDAHDLLTVNEVFCRLDYGPASDVGLVVDIGANRGLAALFFLTRHPDVQVVCFEPDPANVALLRRNVAAFADRVTVVEKAVTPQASESVSFIPMGRYGHIAGADDQGAVTLPAVGIVDALEAVAGQIDLVKIDTEGTELPLVAALRESPVAGRVGQIVYEDNHGRTRWIRQR